MNADAYLRKQGWKGSGHSLDSTGRGIKKPLLIAHKQDQLGLGKKKAAYTTDDQWWMRAFDQSLQSIGTGKESTLSQIRTQGINRGGLYGFFVKGEEIKGTIEDASETATDTSIPPSGTNTPPTSASDTEAPKTTTNMSGKEKKRKRAGADVTGASKKAKTAPAQPESEKFLKRKAEGKDQDAVAAKLSKLKSSEKAEYETRAAAKNQTLEQYILRRIQKKAEKRATKYVEPSDPPLFVTDLEGDINLLKNAQTTTPIIYTPLPNSKLPLGPTTSEGRDFDSLPTPSEAPEAMDIANSPRTSSENRSKQDDESDDENQTNQTASKSYISLAEESCPLDPSLWEGQKLKSLPKPVRDARRRWMAEQRLAKKLKKVATGKRKEEIGLTKVEKQLLKEQALKNEGTDPTQLNMTQWGNANMGAKRRAKKEEEGRVRWSTRAKGRKEKLKKDKEKRKASEKV